MERKQTDIEQREIFTPSSLALRESDNGKIIEGVAIVVNKETVLHEWNDYREVEIIAASCLDDKFLREQDIKLNLLHDRHDTIARTPISLRIQSREDGLHFEADVPDCDLGKRAQELIANGTYTGCSFEFRAKDYTTTERVGSDGKTEYVIRHTAFKKIEALTIAMDPVYKDTSVSVRELFKQQHPESKTDDMEEPDKPVEPVEDKHDDDRDCAKKAECGDTPKQENESVEEPKTCETDPDDKPDCKANECGKDKAMRETASTRRRGMLHRHMTNF